LPEPRTYPITASFLWSTAFYVALCLALLPGHRLGRRAAAAGIGSLILFALHAAYVFFRIRSYASGGVFGDISRSRFSDLESAVYRHGYNFLRLALDWMPIAIWLVPFVRSGSVRSLRRGTPATPPPTRSASRSPEPTLESSR